MEIARGLPASLPAVIGVQGAAPLLPDALVRYLPDRRAVLRGIWNDRRVYAKLFFGKQARRHARRDRQGAESLAHAHLATPALLHAGVLAGNAGWVLIFAEVAGQSVDALWDGLTDAQRFELACMLVREVARHHKAGLMQTDLYLKNFLLQEETLYTLDGDGVRRLPMPWASHRAWRNLALLLSKFDVVALAQWLPGLLQAYVSERGCRTMALAKLAALVASERHRVVDGYADKKVFRNCSDVAVTSHWRYLVAQVRDFATAPDQLRPEVLDHAVEAMPGAGLKRGNTCTVSLATIAGRKVVVKRYNIKHWLHGLGRIFRRTRASISWANAHRLRLHEVATAQPLALIERRFGPCRLQAYFVAEYLEAPDMANWMADRAVDMQDKQAAAMHLARLIYKLRLLQIAHGDMKATNIHVRGVAPVLIDLDSMRHVRCRWRFERQHVRDLKRLLRNWADRPHVQRMVIRALQETYGDDPLLQRAGVAMP